MTAHPSSLFFSYLAGFLDGDGCILAQIVRRKDYRFKFEIRISILFYQKTSRHWFLLQLKEALKLGTLRKRNDGMSELAIVGAVPACSLLKNVFPYLRAKKSTASLVFEIADKLSKVNSEGDFIEVCKLVDKVAEFTDSRGRTNTSALVLKTFGMARGGVAPAPVSPPLGRGSPAPNGHAAPVTPRNRPLCRPSAGTERSRSSQI